MRNKKRRMEFFSFYNHTSITAHLEKMARNGWLLEEIRRNTWIYRRIEPKKLRFAVSYYPKASEYDPEPSPEQRDFWATRPMALVRCSVESTLRIRLLRDLISAPMPYLL